MLTTNSLSAFSSATTTAPVQSAGPARLVRERREAPDLQSVAPAKPLPGTPPSGFTPRGTLLNLSV